MSLFKSRVVAVVAAASVIGVATTTGAVAAKMITGDDIKNGTITTKDVANGSLKSSDIKNGSLSFKDLNDKAKDKLAGQDGQDGADGAVGPAGTLDANVIHWSKITEVPANSNGATAWVGCNESEQPDGSPTPDRETAVALGGGFNVPSRNPGVYISQSRNELTNTQGKGWMVTVNNTTDKAQKVQVWVNCLSLPGDNPQD